MSPFLFALAAGLFCVLLGFTIEGILLLSSPARRTELRERRKAQEQEQKTAAQQQIP